jgi:hypothetical protein
LVSSCLVTLAKVFSISPCFAFIDFIRSFSSLSSRSTAFSSDGSASGSSENISLIRFHINSECY